MPFDELFFAKKLQIRENCDLTGNTFLLISQELEDLQISTIPRFKGNFIINDLSNQYFHRGSP